MENMYKYLFVGIVAFMGVVFTLRFLDRIPLWAWVLFFFGMGAVYFVYRKRRGL